MRSLPLPVALFVLPLAAWVPCGPARAQDDQDAPVITHDEVEVFVQGRDLEIVATIEDPSGVFDPTVLFRVGGSGKFLRAPMKKRDDGAYVARVPADLIVADLEYFIEAYDELGNGPARHGTEELPVAVKVVAPSATPEAGEPGEGDPGARPSDGTGGAGDDGAGEAEEGTSWGLILGGVGAGGAAVVVLGAAATAVGVAVYYLYTQGQNPPPDPEGVTLVVTSPAPTAQALGGGP